MNLLSEQHIVALSSFNKFRDIDLDSCKYGPVVIGIIKFEIDLLLIFKVYPLAIEDQVPNFPLVVDIESRKHLFGRVKKALSFHTSQQIVVFLLSYTCVCRPLIPI